MHGGRGMVNGGGEGWSCMGGEGSSRGAAKAYPRQGPLPHDVVPLFPLPGEREEGEGSWGEGYFG